MKHERIFVQREEMESWLGCLRSLVPLFNKATYLELSKKERTQTYKKLIQILGQMEYYYNKKMEE